MDAFFLPELGLTSGRCCLQLNELSPTFAENHNYLPQLYNMLQDADSTVVMNVILAINELQLADGGLQLTQANVMSLLNRLGEFSEWGLNSVLELVARYRPRNEDETYAIMNLLDPVLRTANSGAVLATIKCFLALATSMGGDMLPQIYSRAKPPLLTFVTGANFEVQFAVLKHLQVSLSMLSKFVFAFMFLIVYMLISSQSILVRPEAKGIFDSEFRQFFVRYNEPSHVKQMKVDLLPLIANDTNAKDIATELSEYVVDVDSELSKRSISALAEIAMRVQSVSSDITTTLIDLVDLDIPYVRSQAVKCLTSIIRVFPAVRSIVLPALSKCLRKVEDPDAKACMIWLLGEFGEEIIEAPYYLEPIIDNYDEEQNAGIKLQLLSSTMTLFFKRPPEMHAMLGRLLAAAVNDTGNQDVHDRALLYYRLLSSRELEATKSLFNYSCQDQPLSSSGNSGGFVFAEDMDEDLRNKIFREFNTLAVIYGMPSVHFVDDKYQLVRYFFVLCVLELFLTSDFCFYCVPEIVQRPCS
jgi:AP-4 complex subunit beta-1